jgi:hypothetical protein
MSSYCPTGQRSASSRDTPVRLAGSTLSATDSSQAPHRSPPAQAPQRHAFCGARFSRESRTRHHRLRQRRSAAVRPQCGAQHLRSRNGPRPVHETGRGDSSDCVQNPAPDPHELERVGPIRSADIGRFEAIRGSGDMRSFVQVSGSSESRDSGTSTPSTSLRRSILSSSQPRDS